MTFSRFEQEIFGTLGDFWKHVAEKRVSEYKSKAELGEILTDSKGAAYWKSNGSYLPSDCAEVLSYTGFDFNAEATKVARDKEDFERIARYRDSMKNHACSEEELYEMRAAFGTGTEVMNVLIGKK